MVASFELVEKPKASVPFRWNHDRPGIGEVLPELGIAFADPIPYLVRDIAKALSQGLRLSASVRMDQDRADEMMARCQLLVGELGLLWTTIAGQLQQSGLEAGQCRKLCEVALEAFDTGLEALTIARDLAKADTLTYKISADRLESLEGAIHEVTTLRPRVARLFEQASAPHGPVDREKMHESDVAFDQGRYTSLRDYLARRRSGGNR
jgi:hypothetical protein